MPKREPPSASDRAAATIAHCNQRIADAEFRLETLIGMIRLQRTRGLLTNSAIETLKTSVRQTLKVRRAYRAMRRASQRSKDMADGLLPMQSVFDPAEAIA